MITLHHLERSRSHRILWLLEELELEYQIKVYRRDPKSLLAPDELKELHPLGKSPILTDGSQTLAESSVIIEYLLDQHGAGRLRPAKDDKNYYQYLYFLHAAEGSFMPYLFLSFVMSRFSQPPVPIVIRPVAKMLEMGLNHKLLNPNFRSQLQFLEDTLKSRAWLAGDDFSAADIQMSYPLQAAESRVGLKNYPKISEYNNRLKSRAAYQVALEKGGPVAL